MEKCIEELCDDMNALWQPPQAKLERKSLATLTPDAFYREFVSKSVPVILTDAINPSEGWQPTVLQQWQNPSYLCEKAGNQPISVNVTPFGYGDAILQLNSLSKAHNQNQIFVMPEERAMKLKDFYHALHHPETFSGVPYVSYQNDNLRNQFAALYQEVPPYLNIAKEAFGNVPDAINLWIGDERSTSSLHKDFYENMYCVIKGTKVFTLLPPAAILCLSEIEVDTYRYLQGTCTTKDDLNQAFHRQYPHHSSWNLMQENRKTPWIPIDPTKLTNQAPEGYPFASTQYLKPIHCEISTGEVLYLPALWYHQATQLDETISVNYWYEMRFDFRYVYYNCLHNIGKLC